MSEHKYKFEVQASKEVIVEGFTDVEMARQWLINNLEEECYDIVNPSTYVSDGQELGAEVRNGNFRK